MNKEVNQLNAQHLAFQRNIFVLFSFSLVIVSLTLSGMLYFKDEKIVIVPEKITETIWVKKGRVSGSYLKQQAQVVAMLFLSKTPATATEQAKSLLEISSPALYGSLKRKLADEIDVLNKQGTSYLFLPIDIKVNEDAMSVEILGNRTTYLGGKQLKSESERYRLGFIYNGRNLLIDSITREEVK